MSTNFSTSEENYIKAIFHLQKHEDRVSTNQLSEELKTKAASVTDMLKKLKRKKLLQYEPYQGVRLNAEGKRVALSIIRKHRLWEFFLVDKLKFGWDEVHEVAEELEHVSSNKLIELLDGFLNYPKFDPHGDPIPDSHGKMQVQQQLNLIDVPLNQPVEICAVSSRSAALLELLSHKKILIGTRLEVKQKFSFDNSVEIRLKNRLPFTISQQLAQALFVKPIS